MKSIYKYLQELEKESLKRKHEIQEAKKDPAWEDGYQQAILEIESWIDAYKKEIETCTGYILDVVCAELDDWE